MAGDKESKELLIAGFEVGLLAAKRFKDGVQFADFIAFKDAFFNDPEFEAILKAGYEGVSEVPSEMKDLDVGEIIDLASVAIGYVPKYVEVFKG